MGVAVVAYPARPGVSPFDTGAGALLYGTITMSNSYATGGDTLSFPQYKRVNVIIVGNAVGGYDLVPVMAATGSSGVIRAYASGGTEVAAATNLSTAVAQFIAFVV